MVCWIFITHTAGKKQMPTFLLLTTPWKKKTKRLKCDDNVLKHLFTQVVLSCLNQNSKHVSIPISPAQCWIFRSFYYSFLLIGLRLADFEVVYFFSYTSWKSAQSILVHQPPICTCCSLSASAKYMLMMLSESWEDQDEFVNCAHARKINATYKDDKESSCFQMR